MEFTDRKLSMVGCLAPHLRLVTDSQDVAAIHEHLGPDSHGYDAFFVAIDDGDYSEVWGMVGVVPYLSKFVSRFIPK